ncbi:MAG: hypothetical protein GF418_00945 [Chitinivibrionales bacterium]|nr:hypothetical protein [Chitinivibrionales bacterium]MBD3394168.1 hypothetical protein [Chitinivibrionales bacterium]
MSKPTAALLTVFVLTAVAGGADDSWDAHRDFLRTIKSPEELVLPHFPRSYRVPLTLSGPVADEMHRTLAALDLKEPEYVEVFDRKDRFHLLLANKSYTAETRDLLSGILNPVEMIEAVLQSIVRYREKELLEAMLRETRVSRTREMRNDTAVHVVRIEPTGTRFNYTYEDRGAFIREHWLTGITLAVDAGTMTARELALVKHTRLMRGDDAAKPRPATRRHRYVFSYARAGELTVPSRLDLYVNDSLALTISATYRLRQEFVVFDTRTICYSLPKGRATCLHIQYGRYDFDPGFRPARAAGKQTEARDVREAAEEARKASIALREGRISAAVRTLRNIVQDYPGTPQAVEARNLLEGLPEGF